MTVAIGVNRWDGRTIADFAASVAHGEACGVDVAFQPVNPLLAYDPYLLLAAAAAQTSTIRLGTLLDTPMLRPPAIAANSIASLDEISNGRAMLTYGVGDTAVRMLGQRPARVAELEQAVADARRLLSGEALDVEVERPVRLRMARPVPVWVAASGPRTLRSAGRVADGVFIRVGTHLANIEHAVAQVRAGAAEAGRELGSVAIGLIVHTIRSSDPQEIADISRCMAAGFYEYAPAVFDAPRFEWNLAPIHELQEHVWPDFHHTNDFAAAGRLIKDLPQDIADSFSFHGSAANIADQIRVVELAVPELKIVVLHPVPFPKPPDIRTFSEWIGDEVKPLLQHNPAEMN